jgi:hypothetical protein
MLRLAPFLVLLAGCISGPTEAHVAWKTNAAPSAADPDIGTQITYDGEYGADSMWIAGVQGTRVLDVYGPRICVAVLHRTPEYYEQFGQEKMDWTYELKSQSLCDDAGENDKGLYIRSFTLDYQP